MCLFEGDVIFLNPYLLCMMESRYMISWSILKIFLNTIKPWIYFSYDIDTLKNVCDFLYDFIWCFIIIFFKKIMHAPMFFYLIWTFWNFWASLLQFDIWMSVWILVSCSRRVGVVSRNFFVIKIHSKTFFRNYFCDAPFTICMLMTQYLLELLLFLESFDLF